MKILKTLFLTLLLSCLLFSSVFAITDKDNPVNEQDQTIQNERGKYPGESKKIEDQGNPIENLKMKKKIIESLRKEGKISDEKAAELQKILDERIKKNEEFNKLPLQKKKEILLQNFKTRIEEKVKAGKITREQADKIIKEFSEKIKKWDGNENPKFRKKRFKLF